MYCLECKEKFDTSHYPDQLSLAIECISTFIDECDEFLGDYKHSALSVLRHFQEKINKTGEPLTAEGMNLLKMLLRDLGRIGGNKCEGVIEIPKDGKFTIMMREQNNLVSKNAALLLSTVVMSFIFIFNEEK
jgi:hypothetical protein